ncbi:MAG: hypothetical protein HQ523_09295 [Lentisphaerae bacterium]|nr:hypothetical protein [Lentisphaerota bacterium]
MSAWWESLTAINRAFFSAAAFFSVFFMWQLVAALTGLDNDSDHDAGGVDTDVDTDGDTHMHHFEPGTEADSAATVVAFKLLSIRALITFCTLFTWGSALYLSRGVGLGRAMGVSAIWGLAGMASVALVLSLLPKLAHTGTKRIASALGAHGMVYLDIPAEGRGEIRVAVSDVVSYVKARSRKATAIKSGTPVVVTAILDQTTVEVDIVPKTEEGGKQ